MLPGAGPPPPTIVGVDVGATVVGVRVDVLVGVFVGVFVGAPVGVFVGVFVGVLVGPRTTRQLDSTPFVTLVTVTFPESLVNAGGSPTQLELDCPAALVTFTLTVHDAAPAGTFRLLTAIVLVSATAVVAAAAFEHVPLTTGGFATTRPLGRLSTNPTFNTNGAPAGFAIVNVKTVVPPELMVVGEKLLVSVGATTPENTGAGNADRIRNASTTTLNRKGIEGER
jgi:hypothetical protein